MTERADDFFFEHYGVPGMHWGQRKSRTNSITLRGEYKGKRGDITVTGEPGVSKRKLKKQISKDPDYKIDAKQPKPPKKGAIEGQTKVPNTFKNNPGNKRLTDAQLRAAVNRLQMEKQYAELTAPKPATKSFARQLLEEQGKSAARTLATKAVGAAIKLSLEKAAGSAAAGSAGQRFFEEMVASGQKGGKGKKAKEASEPEAKKPEPAAARPKATFTTKTRAKDWYMPPQPNTSRNTGWGKNDGDVFTLYETGRTPPPMNLTLKELTTGR